MTTGQSWDAAEYAAHGRFVARLATEVVELLEMRAGEEILDVGCGDGALTAELAASGAKVIGVDASETMVKAARVRGGFAVERCAAQEMRLEGRFDAVFSNAALHWISEAEQGAALERIYRALRPGGRLVAELGGQGNIASIRAALSAVLGAHGLDAEELAGSFFPSAERYRGLLEEVGFRVERIAIHPRPTVLPGGAEGLEVWLNTFRNGVLDRLGQPERDEAVAEVVRLLRPILFDPAMGRWTADYVRLRLRAWRDG